MQEKTGWEDLKQQMAEHFFLDEIGNISLAPAGKTIKCFAKPAGDHGLEPMNLFRLIFG